MDWRRYATSPSDLQRTWNICTDVLLDLQPGGPNGSAEEGLRTALNYWFLLPEGHEHGRASGWLAPVIAQAMAGDATAANRVLAHLTHEAAATTSSAVGARLALAAWQRFNRRPVAAATALGGTLEHVSPLAAPARVEVVTLVFCASITLLGEVARDADQALPTSFTLNQAAQHCRPALQSGTDDPDERSFVGLADGLLQILIAVSGLVMMPRFRGAVPDPDPLSLLVAQRIEDATGGHWPVTPWVKQVWTR